MAMHTRLREIRTGRVYSQAELATLAGVNEGTVVRLELGRGKAQPSTLRKLAKALGVAPWELLATDSPPTAAEASR